MRSGCHHPMANKRATTPSSPCLQKQVAEELERRLQVLLSLGGGVVLFFNQCYHLRTSFLFSIVEHL